MNEEWCFQMESQEAEHEKTVNKCKKSPTNFRGRREGLLNASQAKD